MAVAYTRPLRPLSRVWAAALPTLPLGNSSEVGIKSARRRRIHQLYRGIAAKFLIRIDTIFVHSLFPFKFDALGFSKTHACTEGSTPKMSDANQAGGSMGPARRRNEVITFLVLAFGIWPIAAVGFVGAYGFLVWMFQIIFGPPGPPAH